MGYKVVYRVPSFEEAWDGVAVAPFQRTRFMDWLRSFEMNLRNQIVYIHELIANPSYRVKRSKMTHLQVAKGIIENLKLLWKHMCPGELILNIVKDKQFESRKSLWNKSFTHLVDQYGLKKVIEVADAEFVNGSKAPKVLKRDVKGTDGYETARVWLEKEFDVPDLETLRKELVKVERKAKRAKG